MEVVLFRKRRYLQVFLRKEVFSFISPVTAGFDDFPEETKSEAHVVWVPFVCNDFVAPVLFLQASLTYSVLEIFICSHSTRLLDQL